MRNLKKFLALVMAMVMAFSLMLTANAASKYDQVKEWTDKDQVTEDFIEAVDVLSGMKIFQGDARGFAPGDTITRAETAALIYRLSTGDVDNVRNGLYANYGNFVDVNENDWFAGYVGYCANAGYIKGHGGYFNPYAPVTGYEALAMILRAVGYDKNHEFEGAAWQTNVSALGTRLGVLDDVKTSDYANTLHLPSRRDVVASILFACAQLDTVTYTPSLGYETGYIGNGGTADGLDGKSLGKVYFGLTKVEGIIVGNQDTGESKTIINSLITKDEDGKATGFKGYLEYFYENDQYLTKTATAKTPVTTSAKCDAKTGIDMFGHKVKVWYNADNKAGTTYALYDNVKKTALVTPLDANGDMTATGGSILSKPDDGDAPLGRAAQKAGFSVDLKDSRAVFNQSFQKSGTNAKGAADGTYFQIDYQRNGTWTNATTDDEVTRLSTSLTKDGQTGNTEYPLYLLISNNDDLTVDMIVALNVSVSRISQVNAYASIPTVTVAQVTPAIDNAGAGTPKPAAWNDKKGGMIDQKALTATSDKELRTPVVGVAIVGTKPYKPTSASTTAIGNTNGGTSALSYRLSKPLETVEGTVTNFNYSATAHDGSIVIGGKKIERSLLADAIAGYDPAPATANRGIGVAGLSATANLYGNYRAYLDEEGKYVWIEPIYDTEFVYGTYIDYTTPYASSTYEYTLVGVNLKGEQVKKVVKTIDGKTLSASSTTTTEPMSYLTIPYRDSASVAGVTPGAYTGFLVDSEGNLTGGSFWKTPNKTSDFKISPTVTQVGKGTNGSDATPTGILKAAESWSINTTDAKLGTKKLDADGGAGTTTNKYFTNDTKFIVVDGAGTDTQKVKVYTGLTELLDGGTNVTIKGAAMTANWVHDGTTTANTEMYYTQSALTYASIQGNPMKIDTIILPKDAITWTGRSNLFYLGSSNYDSMITTAAGHNFYLYTMYENGEKVQKWVTNATSDTLVGPGTNTSLTADGFYVLADSGLKTPTGETVYTAHDDGTANGSGVISGTLAYGGITQKLDGNDRPDSLASNCYPIRGGATNTAVYYNAATYASQTATITEDAGGAVAPANNPAIFNVANAKVVNVNATNTGNVVWPGVVDLGTLNDASSTATVYQTNLPKVAIQTDPTDPLTVTVIYVCFDQT